MIDEIKTEIARWDFGFDRTDDAGSSAHNLCAAGAAIALSAMQSEDWHGRVDYSSEDGFPLSFGVFDGIEFSAGDVRECFRSPLEWATGKEAVAFAEMLEELARQFRQRA